MHKTIIFTCFLVGVLAGTAHAQDPDFYGKSETQENLCNNLAKQIMAMKGMASGTVYKQFKEDCGMEVILELARENHTGHESGSLSDQSQLD